MAGTTLNRRKPFRWPFTILARSAVRSLAGHRSRKRLACGLPSIPPAQLARLCKMIRKDFPADDMMYELHVLRACTPVREGYAKIEGILPATPLIASSRR